MAHDRIDIPEDDEDLLAECRVETFRAGGPGGQHQNKTESGVRLVHIPTGTRIIARESRSQHRNRSIAIDRLREELTRMNQVKKPRKKTKVPRASREKRLEEKRQRSDTKRRRRPPDPDS